MLTRQIEELRKKNEESRKQSKKVASENGFLKNKLNESEHLLANSKAKYDNFLSVF